MKAPVPRPTPVSYTHLDVYKRQALAWAVYLACTCNGLDIFAGLFFATLAAALASELLARAVKAPVIMLLVPMLLSLIHILGRLLL